MMNRLRTWFWTEVIRLKTKFIFKHRVQLADQPGAVVSGTNDPGMELYADIYEWLEENNLNDDRFLFTHIKLAAHVEDQMGNQILIKLDHRFVFYFKDENDAIFFKMRWLDEQRVFRSS